MDLNPIPSSEFCDALAQRGFDFFTGVPCSIFNPLYKELRKRLDWRYVAAVREDAAVGIAVGAYASGRRPVVIMQNSGLGYSLNAFTSLAIIYEVPLLVLISWRGYLGKDAPEHIVMGASMLDLLRDIGVRSLVLGSRDAREELGEAESALRETRKPVFLAVRDGVLQ